MHATTAPEPSYARQVSTGCVGQEGRYDSLTHSLTHSLTPHAPPYSLSPSSPHPLTLFLHPSTPGKHSGCLSEGEAKAIDKIWAGSVNADGSQSWYGIPRGADFGALAGERLFSIADGEAWVGGGGDGDGGEGGWLVD